MQKNLTVKKYSSKRHFSSLLSLHRVHGDSLCDILTPSDIPQLGYVVYYNGIIVVIGFLRKMEGGYGMFDTFVSNPTITSDIRHLCLTTLVNELQHTAKCLKLKSILSLTMNKGILDRAKAIGFKEINQTAISLTL